MYIGGYNLRLTPTRLVEASDIHNNKKTTDNIED